MSDAQCNENWHVFAAGLPQPGECCRCGLKRATAKLGVLEDAVPDSQPGTGCPRSLVTTELGMEVPVKPGEEYRVHTAERWRDPDSKHGDVPSYEFALYLIRSLGIVNKSKLKELVDEHRAVRGLGEISRNTIIALFHDRTLFKPGEIDEIIRTRSALLTADTLAKLEEVIDKAKSAKDIGGVAMALTSIFNIKQISHGAATRITGRSEDSAKARGFDHFRQLAEKRLKEQQALNPAREPAVIDGAVVPVRAEDLETRGLGDGELRTKVRAPFKTDTAQRVPTDEEA